MRRIRSRMIQTKAKRARLGNLTRTPGGFLVGRRRPKKTCTRICPVTGSPLNGVHTIRNAHKDKGNHNSVRRAYGAVLSGRAVRERIIRAFLVEEQKIVRRVLLLQKAKE